MGGPLLSGCEILSAGEMPRLSEGGTALIRAWIEQAPEPKLVVIDVLAKVRDPRRRDQGLYDSDYAAMEELKRIADEYGIAIVVIHHLRKMDADDPLDQVSGTTGLSGSVDTVLVLNRTSSGTTLHGRGRDIEDIEKAVQFDQGTCTWTVLGEASSVRYSGERAAVLAALREAGEPMSPTDVAAITGMKLANVRKLLARSAKDGLIVRVGRGKYAPAPNPSRRHETPLSLLGQSQSPKLSPISLINGTGSCNPKSHRSQSPKLAPIRFSTLFYLPNSRCTNGTTPEDSGSHRSHGRRILLL